MQMAASASCCSTFRFDFPSAFYSQTIRKKPSAPFHLSTSYSFLSHSTRKISSIFRSHHVYPPIVSRLNDPVIDDPTKHNNIPQLQIKTCSWNWRGYSIRYQYSGNNGPVLVLVHGFGANRSSSFIFCLSSTN
ncbi:hypothetical protein CsSME_00042480 [Camellia sinensis var. sinensis]